MPSHRTPSVLLFLLALLAPAAVQLFSDRAPVSTAEKRALAAMPAWPGRWSEWGAFPGALDRFARDHFGLREPLAAGWGLLKYALGQTPGVAVGRDGWLYYPQYWGAKYGATTCGPLSAEVRAFADRLDRVAAYAARGRVRLLFAVAPDKETLYPEYLPGKTEARGRCDLLAELTAALADKRRIATLDLLTPLREEKTKAQVYFRTDSHWNDAGRWIAARILLEGVCAPGSVCPKLPQPFASTKTYGGDLAALLGLASVLTERTVTLDIAADRHAGRALAVVGDSFAKSLVPFLAADDSIGSVSFVDHGDGRMDLRPIVAAKPDAVLVVIVERFLYDRDFLRAFAAGLPGPDR